MPRSIDTQDSHELRIMRLESEQPELTSQLATVALQQRHMGDQQEGLRAELVDRMDDLKIVIVAQATETSNKLDKVVLRVEGLEASVQKYVWLKSVLSKAVTPIMVIAAVILTRFGEDIYKWMTS